MPRPENDNGLLRHDTRIKRDMEFKLEANAEAMLHWTAIRR
jgi:hypothetical protein